MTVKDRLKIYLGWKKINASEFGRTIGVSNAYISSMVKSIPPDKLKRITLNYPDLNTEWLMTGNGDMLKDSQKKINDHGENSLAIMVPLLPISAQGGRLDDFVVSINAQDCEKLISPIKGADFAMTVSGDSMAPEYPSGSKILVKKINERSFIEWGRCYVLDTCNGTVIKKLDAPTDPDSNWGMEYVTCISVNPSPIYKPFRIPTSDIYGMYRVMMMLTEK